MQGKRLSVSLIMAIMLLAGRYAHAQDERPAEGNPAAEANTAERPVPQYNARHTFEIHQASLLRKFIQDELRLSVDQRARIDREFAEFIRLTMEDQPRPILIAYSANNKFSYDGQIIEAEGDTTDKLMEEMGSTGHFKRPLFVDTIRDHLEAVQMARFQVILDRWNALRPPPLDGGFQRLSRALGDPQLSLRQETLEAAHAEIEAAVAGVPKPDRQPKYMDKYEAPVRERVIASLPPDKVEPFKKVLAFLEADYLEWKQPGYVEKVYLDALRTLTEGDAGQPAPTHKPQTEAAAPPGTEKPN